MARLPKTTTGPFHFNVARPERFELPTTWFVARYSIQLSYGRVALRGRASYHTGFLCREQRKPLRQQRVKPLFASLPDPFRPAGARTRAAPTTVTRNGALLFHRIPLRWQQKPGQVVRQRDVSKVVSVGIVPQRSQPAPTSSSSHGCYHRDPSQTTPKEVRWRTPQCQTY